MGDHACALLFKSQVNSKSTAMVNRGDSFHDGELVNERYRDQIRRLGENLIALIERA